MPKNGKSFGACRFFLVKEGDFLAREPAVVDVLPNCYPFSLKRSSSMITRIGASSAFRPDKIDLANVQHTASIMQSMRPEIDFTSHLHVAMVDTYVKRLKALPCCREIQDVEHLAHVAKTLSLSQRSCALLVNPNSTCFKAVQRASMRTTSPQDFNRTKIFLISDKNLLGTKHFNRIEIVEFCPISSVPNSDVSGHYKLTKMNLSEATTIRPPAALRAWVSHRTNGVRV